MGYTNYYYIKEEALKAGIPESYLNTMRKLKKLAAERKIDMKFKHLNKNEVVIEGPCEWFVLAAKCLPWEVGRSFRFTKTQLYDYDPYVKVAIMAAINEGLVSKWSCDCYTDNVDEDAGFKIAVQIANEIGVTVVRPDDGGDA
jgi:hypothetical protein